MSARLMIVAALASSAGAGVAAGIQTKSNWADEKDYPEFADSKAACRRVGPPRLPASDRPTAAERATLKGCDSEALYYGIGMKPDYAKARKCAAIEAEGTDDKFFGGSMILMQLYANGYGVKRNPDLATAFSCGIDGAPMENDLRIHALQSLKTEPAGKAFDFCDFVTSGLAQGFCASHFARETGAERDVKLAATVAGFPSAGRGAWPTLNKVFAAYVDASAGGETDLSGTARGAFVVEAEEKMRDQQLKDLQRLRAGQWPAASAAESKEADAKLNASYRKALAWAAGKDNMTTVKPDDIRKTQRAWLAYRDAYLRFAVSAAPAVTRDAILTRLTKLRLAELDSLASE